MTANTPLLRAENLGKHVVVADGELDILAGVTFNLQAGSSLAIVGASGSGKSTLLALLAGLDVPTRGEAWLAGSALSTLDEDGRARLRARHAGFVFQSFQLLPELTALENVMLPLELHAGKGQPRKTLEATAREWLQRVGLGSRIDHTPRTLSGGEQQRVALARAFAAKPQLLFADEPTGSLDTHTGEQVAELLFELNRETGTTLVLVTHDNLLAARCGARLRLGAGQIVDRDGV
ncbi:putative ABC transport system ATP-binding protein [Andreprevotia lacus DSM 23236]|uniref:Putative ABC transport system ATP-binding protein n=1 Tax=Andreprevotia lacus DSM 23236 TaxID=1121001 RepID=A0A1W1WYA2_9NEIS|nr:ATP-binding cassette domain-containing protein [Andreprevotia lacus]SMC16408.1 putative ABC transport system ATP-binding protein [Andreprevotia lacus DSM 23236]